MQSLKEIANMHSKKQPKMVDNLTEDAPILERLKWIAATHKLWNVAEKVSDIKGAGFVELNAPLPRMSMSTDLVQTPVSILGGEMEVPQDTADQFGGASAYFAKKQPTLLRQSGMDTEKLIYTNYWRKGALLKKSGVDLGGVTDLSSILIVRLDEECNVGIFDPTQFNQGRLLNIMPINNGSLYHLNEPKDVLGYGVSFKGRFGWQLIDPEKSVFALFNIAKNKTPTTDMLDDAIAKIKGSEKNTLIISHPRTIAMVFPAQKMQHLQIANGDTNMNTVVTHYNKIPIVSSYNIPYATEVKVEL